ncbi:endonuclease domain-containing protein [Marinobacterium sp. BA1]|uniref:endonuclease domain-containing protein n=1 Tax=Marinobacterium sp. BA1 TaxID=3138931 RepID=UPI0032E73A66
MRFSEADIKRLGIVVEGNRAKVTTPYRRASHMSNEPSDNFAKFRQHTSSQSDPQQLLFDALIAIEGLNVCWEQKNLIPNRKYRADIYLPESQVIVEMDGFKYHRSKDAFQSDRMRQNLMVENGFHVLRFFTRQVFNELDMVITQILSVHQRYHQEKPHELYA